MRKELWPKPSPPFTSVFFGGGTPSLLHPKQLEYIVKTLRDCYTFSDDCEWTMECNPGTVSLESLGLYREAGINRLSFGVQSFNERDLRFLERIHNASDVVSCVSQARSVGFDNINLDIMFALPGQTINDYDVTLRRILELEPEHVSAYSLIYEEGTPLHAQLLRGEVQPSSEDVDARMYEHTIDVLEHHGYSQYEVSNFAKTGHRCRHNLCYWHGDNYLAFGPSAHGYADTTRYRNIRNISRYMECVTAGNVPTIGSETLTREQQMFESVFLGLRSTGIDVVSLHQSFGCNLAELIRTDEPWLEDEGFVNIDNAVSLTKKGFLICDDLTLRLIKRVENRMGIEWEPPSSHDDEIDDSIQHPLNVL